ncbi:MAG: NAD(P)/FAD-dependent oxidoreductase [Anaerolineae bacterium]|nr:NAD(P)/FAD-dependent oxidoreductase [Anaerolineae bacterium]
MKDKTHLDIVIIGAGMSGLTAGAYLARENHRVTVYEQYSRIGGSTATMHEKGFGWDIGPLLLEGFAPDERAGRILRELGVSDQVSIQEDDRGYVFPEFNLWKPGDYQGPYWRRDKLTALFPYEQQGLKRYYKFYNQILDLFTLSVRAENAHKPMLWLLKLQMWRIYNKIKEKESWSAQQLMDEFFIDPRVKAVYTSILADFVTRPSEFPALGVPLLNVENSFDQRIPRKVSAAGKRPSYSYILGGCENLAEAVASVIRKYSGLIYTNTGVKQILIDGDHIRGVRLSGGQFVHADVVIATGGIRETFFNMVGKTCLPSVYVLDLEDQPCMESVFMVQLGIDFDPRPYQPGGVCYYYGTYDVEQGIQRCIDGDYHEGADGFVVYIPSMHSPQLAPDGHHCMTIYTIAPNKLNKGDWAARKEELANLLLVEAEQIFPDLRQHIKVRIILTPDDFKNRLNLEHHAFGGRSPIMGKTGPGYQTPIEGLWFIGSQSKSGGGVQNVMIGARDAVHQIIEYIPYMRDFDYPEDDEELMDTEL